MHLSNCKRIAMSNLMPLEAMQSLLENAHQLLMQEDYAHFIEMMEPFQADGSSAMSDTFNVDKHAILLLVSKLSNLIDLLEQKNLHIADQLTQLRTQLRANKSYQK